MIAEDKKVVLEKVGQNQTIIKIRFTGPMSQKLSTLYLTAALTKCFKNKFYKIILDLAHIDNPSPDFIATLIEATAKVRIKDGDIKIINMSEASKQGLAAFNAYAYLSVTQVGKDK